MGAGTGNEAWVDLEFTAHAAPAHPIIVVVTALYRSAPTLIVEQDARRFLKNVPRGREFE